MSSCGKINHCCYFRGVVCQYLVESPREDFRWACGLRLKYGTWDKMYQSEEYTENVKPKLLNINVKENCGDWPLDGRYCGSCGLNANIDSTTGR